MRLRNVTDALLCFIGNWQVHTRLFDRTGPQSALRYITLFVVLQLALISVVLDFIEPSIEESVVHRWISRTLLFFLFVSQSAFVQLLYSQHWSFLSSVLTEEEGAVWFAPIAGFGSLASTFLAWQVLPMVDQIGLTGLLQFGSLLVFLCSVCSDRAYSIAAEVSCLLPKDVFIVFLNDILLLTRLLLNSMAFLPQTTERPQRPVKQEYQPHQTAGEIF